MAKIRVTLVQGDKGPEIHVGYESDSDATAREHELDHRAAVAKLMGMSVADLEDSGVPIVRAKTAAPAPSPSAEPESARELERAMEDLHRARVRANPGRARPLRASSRRR